MQVQPRCKDIRFRAGEQQVIISLLLTLFKLVTYLSPNSFRGSIVRQESTRVPKMIASRSFAFAARQCLLRANASRPWPPAIAPITPVCEVTIAYAASEDNAYRSCCSKRPSSGLTRFHMRKKSPSSKGRKAQMYVKNPTCYV